MTDASGGFVDPRPDYWDEYGRDLMKDCIWKVCPDGGFYARKSDDPSQELLIKPSPNLTPLREWVLGKLRERPERWRALLDELRQTLWREAHLNRVIRQLRKEGVIAGRDGKFVPSSNPELFIRDPEAKRTRRPP